MSHWILNYLFIFSCFTSCVGQKTMSMPKNNKIAAAEIRFLAKNIPEFKTDPHIQASQGQQIDGIVRRIFQDKKGDFWFGGQAGLNHYNRIDLVFYELNATVLSIAEDLEGNIWIGHTMGLSKFDGEYFTHFTANDGLIKGEVSSLTIDSKNKVWIGTVDGLFYYDGTSFKRFELPETKIDENRGISSTKIIHHIMEDHQGKMWFSSNAGTYIYDGKSLRNLSEKDGLCNDFVNQTMEDSKGNIWFATAHHGLCFFDGNTFTQVVAHGTGEEEDVWCVIEDQKGNIWYNVKGQGLYCYNGKSFLNFNRPIENTGSLLSPMSQVPSSTAFCIYEDQNHQIWYGGILGAYRLEGNSFINITRNGPWSDKK